MLVQEHLPATALPFEMACEVHVADKICLRESNRMEHLESWLVRSAIIHAGVSAAMATASTRWFGRTANTVPATANDPDRSSSQPSLWRGSSAMGETAASPAFLML